jgi:hypothetical protein
LEAAPSGDWISPALDVKDARQFFAFCLKTGASKHLSLNLPRKKLTRTLI